MLKRGWAYLWVYQLGIPLSKDELIIYVNKRKYLFLIF
nr:MAG TPA: hypothetical protein [Bacteriophage sp.]